MRFMILSGILILLLGAPAVFAELPISTEADAGVAPTVEAIDGPDVSRLHVVLIGGINKDPEEIRSKDRAILRLARHFEQRVGVESGNLTILAAPDSFVRSATGESTADSIRAVFSDLHALTEDDRLVIYYTGQANIVGDRLRLNLPGPDLAHTELAEALTPIHPGLMILVLDCPGAGMAAESLAAPNRILVFSARSDQPVSTRFSDYFVPAFDNPESDVNDDGTVTLLEVFQHTVRQIDALFRDQDLMKSENALLEDDGDGTPSQQPWAFAEHGNDGAVAATVAVDAWNLCYNSDQAVHQSPPSTEAGGFAP
jgi:hypothetical protein